MSDTAARHVPDGDGGYDCLCVNNECVPDEADKTVDTSGGPVNTPVRTATAAQCLPGVNCTRCGAVMLDLYRCPNCVPSRFVQVGWYGPYGIIPGDMDNDPAPHWRPVYVER